MRWDPDAKDGNVDHRNRNCGPPFDTAYRLFMLGNDGDSIYDDLEQKLNFKHPEEQDEEKGWYANKGQMKHDTGSVNLRRANLSVEEQPSDYGDGEVGSNLAPEHINVYAAEGVTITPGLLDGFPYCQEPEAEREPGGHRRQLDIRSRRHGAEIDASPTWVQNFTREKTKT